MPYIYGQILNAQLENSVGDPASGGTPLGRVYIDITSTSAAVAKYFNGTAYVPFSASGAPTATNNNTATATFNTTGTNQTIYNTGGTTLATLTLTLPATTLVGQVVRYTTLPAVTSVTVTGGTVLIGAAVTSLSANQTIAYQAVNTTGSFVRIQ